MASQLISHTEHSDTAGHFNSAASQEAVSGMRILCISFIAQSIRVLWRFLLLSVEPRQERWSTKRDTRMLEDPRSWLTRSVSQKA